MSVVSVLIKPVVTEKATKLSEVENKYTFIVSKDADKGEIRLAVEKRYGVSVSGVGIVNVGVKRSRKYVKKGVRNGSSSSYKKAVVSVVSGQSIDFYN